MIRDAALVADRALLFQAVYVVAFTYVLWFWLMRRYPAAGLVELHLSDAGLRRAVRRPDPWRAAGVRYFVALALIGAGLILVNRPAAVPPGGEHACATF